MKNIKFLSVIALISLAFASCSKEGCTDPNAINFNANASSDDGTCIYPVYVQEDQMGRAAINTVFPDGARKNVFNTTPPSQMSAAFSAEFRTKLLALTGGKYTTNALGWDANTISNALSADILNVNTGAASAYIGLNGRTLEDDVMDVDLLLVFGGPTGDGTQMDGTDFSALVSDHVDENDKPFLATFPYLAAPH